MASFNKWIGMGNLTKDAETREVSGGNTVTEWSMAINRKYKTKAGEEREDVCFIDMTCWGRMGEVVAKYCSKGSPLHVEGRLKQDRWEDKDGNKRSKLLIDVSGIQLLGGGKQEGGGSQGTGGVAAEAQAPLPVAAAGSDSLPF
jgi:single-strand DNA-binding protein